MKLKNSLSLVLLTLIGAGVVACGAGGTPQKMPTGPWSMTFSSGLLRLPQDCGTGESGTYLVNVTAGTYDTAGYYSSVTPIPMTPANQLFYGTFDSQIGGGTNGDSCFVGIIGAPQGASSNSFCTNPVIQQGNSIKFTGCTITQINYVYYFNASYQISGSGNTVFGTVSGYNGSAPQ